MLAICLSTRFSEDEGNDGATRSKCRSARMFVSCEAVNLKLEVSSEHCPVLSMGIADFQSLSKTSSVLVP